MSTCKTIRDIEQLDSLLSEPSDVVVQTMRDVPGDILVLGVGGKMGSVLAHMAVRAAAAAETQRRVIGVSRFSDVNAKEHLSRCSVETIQADLLDERSYSSLPDAENVIFLVGQKFGTTGNESATWATNTVVPGYVAQRYPQSRTIVLSTGNIYGLSAVDAGGSREVDPPNPEGEYAMSALGRERVFEYFSRASGTPAAIIRLCYATEMRYGVLVDLAKQVWAGASIDLSMGHVNVLWEADACAMILAALGSTCSPPSVFNLAGPEILNVREVCERMARQMDREVTFDGQPQQNALLFDGSKAFDCWGPPRVDATQLIEWTADWVMRGQADFAKPTHFDSRNGQF